MKALLVIAAVIILVGMIYVGLHHRELLRPSLNEVWIGMSASVFLNECHFDYLNDHEHFWETEEGKFSEIRLLRTEERPSQCVGVFTFRNDKLIAIN